MNTTIVGIVGGSGSGKSTLASALSHHFSGTHVPSDNYYLHNPGIKNFDMPESVDLPRLTEDLCQLKAGRSVQCPVMDFAKHASSTHMTLHPRRYIFVEGLFLYAYAPLMKLCDVRVFIEVDPTLRLERRLMRDVVHGERVTAATPEELKKSMAHELAYYEKYVEPGYQRFVAPYASGCHIRISGNGTKAMMITETIAALNSICSNTTAPQA